MSRVMVISPHFEEYAYLLAQAIAETTDVVLVLKTETLASEYHGRTLPAASRLTVRSNDFASPLDLLRLIVDIVRFRPQVIHWQEPSGLVKTIIACIIVTIFSPLLTLALTIHDPVPHSGRDAAIARRLAPFRRYLRRNVDRIFVHGSACRDQYLAEYLPAPHLDRRVAVTEHGIILSGQANRGGDAPFRALMFGRMEAYKGIEILCLAAEQLARVGLDIPLCMAGTGPELDRLEARFNALPAVDVHNRFIASVDLIEMIVISDCVVLPYTSATQSGVLAAAFANGRFVIASRVGGIADVVEHGVNGLLVPPGDPNALARALHMVASDEALRNRLQEGARRTATERLDWSRIAAGLLSCY